MTEEKRNIIKKLEENPQDGIAQNLNLMKEKLLWLLLTLWLQL